MIIQVKLNFSRVKFISSNNSYYKTLQHPVMNSSVNLSSG